jgi:hypothetical protein
LNVWMFNPSQKNHRHRLRLQLQPARTAQMQPARTAQMQPARRGPRIASRATTAQRSAPRKCNQRAPRKCKQRAPRKCKQPASPRPLRGLLYRWCGQMLPPTHSLHRLLSRWCRCVQHDRLRLFCSFFSCLFPRLTALLFLDLTLPLGRAAGRFPAVSEGVRGRLPLPPPLSSES